MVWSVTGITQRCSFSYWMDISYSYKNRIWESDGRIVAFCFYENPLTDIYFCLRPGYGELAQEMIQYAAKNMPDEGAGIRLVLFGGQDELMESAKRLGYRQESFIGIRYVHPVRERRISVLKKRGWHSISPVFFVYIY